MTSPLNMPLNVAGWCAKWKGRGARVSQLSVQGGVQ